MTRPLELQALTALKGKIAELRERGHQQIILGGPKDFSQYRYLLGGLQSLHDVEVVAQEIFDDILKGD